MSQPAQKISLAQAFELARRLQGDGKLEDARKLYERLLNFQPKHPGALTMLASIGYQTGQDVQADAYLKRANAIYGEILGQRPQDTQVRAALVNQLLARGERGTAEAYAEQLQLQMNPVRSDPTEFARTRERAIQRGRSPMLINTVPKSASETIWNRLAAGLGMAQSHVSIGLFPECTVLPYRMHTFMQGGIIAKEHLPATDYNVRQLRAAGITRMIFHVRDPRQATLSWAHFVQDDVSMRLLAPIWRQVVPKAQVLDDGLSATIDWAIECYLPQLVKFMTDWDALGRDQELDVKFLSFEYFRQQGDAYFDEVLDFYEIPLEAFEPGAESEDVHYRKGEVEEWRDVLTRAQARRAWDQIPRDLSQRFGWRP
jgi:tetratricopeptide (TPR) repeat protein